MKSYTLGELAEKLGCDLIGDPNLTAQGLSTLAAASSQEVAFLANDKYLSELPKTQALAVILPKEAQHLSPTNCLVSSNPYLAFAEATHLYGTHSEFSSVGHNASIAETAKIADSATIGDSVTIGEGVTIHPNVVIGNGVSIGDETIVYPNVTLYPGTQIGKQCIIQAGAVIGSDGFGFANHEGKWVKINQLGHVKMGDRVEVGANTTIDCGALDDTYISDGVKIDNLVQIGHNVRVGKGTIIAGCVGIAGSSVIGKHCMIGGATGIAGHLKITDRVTLTGMSMVTSSIQVPGIYSSGTGLDANKNWRRNVTVFKKLRAMAKSLKILERKSEKLYD